MEHPVEKMRGFLPVSEFEKRPHGERSVAQPAITVIEVQVSTDPFRQGSGRGGDNRTGNRKTQQFESQGAADNVFVKLAVVLRLRSPFLPPFRTQIDSAWQGIEVWQ